MCVQAAKKHIKTLEYEALGHFKSKPQCNLFPPIRVIAIKNLSVILLKMQRNKNTFISEEWIMVLAL